MKRSKSRFNFLLLAIVKIRVPVRQRSKTLVPTLQKHIVEIINLCKIILKFLE